MLIKMGTLVKEIKMGIGVKNQTGQARKIATYNKTNDQAWSGNITTELQVTQIQEAFRIIGLHHNASEVVAEEGAGNYMYFILITMERDSPSIISIWKSSK